MAHSFNRVGKAPRLGLQPDAALSACWVTPRRIFLWRKAALVNVISCEFKLCFSHGVAKDCSPPRARARGSFRDRVFQSQRDDRYRCCGGSCRPFGTHRNSSYRPTGSRPWRQHAVPLGLNRIHSTRFGAYSNKVLTKQRGEDKAKGTAKQDFITQHGLIIAEGLHDVIGLDDLGIPALGIMSNRMTEAQCEKIARFAKPLGINRVNLMFDCDEAETEGAKEALFFFAERQLDVRLVWYTLMNDGDFIGQQPESWPESEAKTLFVNGHQTCAQNHRQFCRSGVSDRISGKHSTN